MNAVSITMLQELSFTCSGSTNEKNLSVRFLNTAIRRPHAYLVCLAYNNNFTFRQQNSGAKKVEDPDQLRTLLTNELAMTHNGYLHIYGNWSLFSNRLKVDNF